MSDKAREFWIYQLATDHMGFCFPVFSTLQLIIHIFIPVIAVGGAIEARG